MISCFESIRVDVDRLVARSPQAPTSFLKVKCSTFSHSNLDFRSSLGVHSSLDGRIHIHGTHKVRLDILYFHHRDMDAP